MSPNSNILVNKKSCSCVFKWKEIFTMNNYRKVTKLSTQIPRRKEFSAIIETFHFT